MKYIIGLLLFLHFGFVRAHEVTQEPGDKQPCNQRDVVAVQVLLKSDSLNLNYYDTVCQLLLITNDHGKGIDYAKKGLHVARQKKDEDYEIKMIGYISAFYRKQKDFLSAYKYADTCRVKSKEKSDPELICQCENRLGLVYEDIGDEEYALQNYDEVYNWAKVGENRASTKNEQNKYLLYTLRALNGIANIYFKKALNSESYDTTNKAYSYTFAYIKAAKQYNDNGEDVSSTLEHNDLDSTSWCDLYNLEAPVYLRKGLIDELKFKSNPHREAEKSASAIDAMHLCIDRANSINDTMDMCDAYYQMAITMSDKCLLLNDITEMKLCETYAGQAMSLAEQFGYNRRIHDISVLLWKLNSEKSKRSSSAPQKIYFANMARSYSDKALSVAEEMLKFLPGVKDHAVKIKNLQNQEEEIDGKWEEVYTIGKLLLFALVVLCIAVFFCAGQIKTIVKLGVSLTIVLAIQAYMLTTNQMGNKGDWITFATEIFFIAVFFVLSQPSMRPRFTQILAGITLFIFFEPVIMVTNIAAIYFVHYKLLVWFISLLISAVVIELHHPLRTRLNGFVDWLDTTSKPEDNADQADKS